MKEPIKTWSTPVTTQESRVIPCALCGSLRFAPALSCEGFAYLRCASCGLVQMNPQPIPGEVRFRYNDNHGDAYLAYEAANESAFLHLQELTLKDLGFYDLEMELNEQNAPRSVLDVGCATGAMLESLALRGWKTAGVEISTPQAEYARQQRGLTVYAQPLEECGFEGGSFQVVLASHLIEHLNDPASFVRTVNHVLSQGGRFIVTTPNIEGFQARLFGSRWRSAIFDHLYLFSRRTLQALLEMHGFMLEGFVTWGGIAKGLCPDFIKKPADRWAKRLGIGDVMALRVRKVRDLD